jgi:hypothetical protein
MFFHGAVSTAEAVKVEEGKESGRNSATAKDRTGRNNSEMS